ncbi:MAG: cyclase family protein [Candidatus Sumerlaeota bacterium]|nr:cyclase family protein [Candidatus Sumerlaeota bacterium]
MKLHDVTRALGLETPPYPGDAAFARVWQASLAREGYNIASLAMSTHTGTHVDAPRHFFDDRPALDEIPIERFFVPALLVECDARDMIRREDLENGTAGGIAPGGIAPGEALILKTRNSLLPFDRFSEEYVYLDVDAAQWIVERKVSLLGFDYYSVDAFRDAESKAHHVLLSAGALIVENLDLRAVETGRYRLACFPLKIPHSDGSPCRAILIGEE